MLARLQLFQEHVKLVLKSCESLVEMSLKSSAARLFERLQTKAASVRGMFSRVQHKPFLYPCGKPGIVGQLVERLRDDGTADQCINLPHQRAQVDGRRSDFVNIGLGPGVLLAAKARLFVVGEHRGCGALRIQRYHGKFETALVKIVVGRVVRGGEQFLDEPGLLHAKIIEIPFSASLLGFRLRHFGLDAGKFSFKLLDLRVFFDAIFAEKVDRCDATGLSEGGIYEISIEYTYLRKSFRRESCPLHPL